MLIVDQIFDIKPGMFLLLLLLVVVHKVCERTCWKEKLGNEKNERIMMISCHLIMISFSQWNKVFNNNTQRSSTRLLTETHLQGESNKSYWAGRLWGCKWLPSKVESNFMFIRLWQCVLKLQTWLLRLGCGLLLCETIALKNCVFPLHPSAFPGTITCAICGYGWFSSYQSAFFITLQLNWLPLVLGSTSVVSTFHNSTGVPSTGTLSTSSPSSTLDHNNGQFFRAMEWLMFFF